MDNVYLNSNISNSLKVKINNILNCFEVTNKIQEITFKLDLDDAYILNLGKSIYLREGILIIYNPFNDGNNIPLYKLLLKNNIEEYLRTHNSIPSIHFINQDILDYRKSNLALISSRYAKINNDKDFVGVDEISKNNFRIRIKDSNSNQIIYKNYNNPISAAISYDYYSNKFYPNETELTNFGLNKYTNDILNSHNIHSINDMYDDISFAIDSDNRKSSELKNSEFDFHGVEKFEKGYRVRVKDENGKRVYIGKTKDKNKIIDLVAKREEYLCTHNSKSKSNLVTPKESNGKIVIAGILKSKNEK